MGGETLPRLPPLSAESVARRLAPCTRGRSRASTTPATRPHLVDDATDDVGVHRERLPPDAYRHIVEHTANPFVVLEVDGTVRFASESIVQVIGWTADDL